MDIDEDDDDDQAWTLSEDWWDLILAAADYVVDTFNEDLESLRSGEVDFKDVSMLDALPPLHLARYDAQFAEAFLDATNSVASKLKRAREEAWPYPSEALLGSVAEEFAMEAILAESEALAELQLHSGVLSSSAQAEVAEAIEMLRDLSFKDRDFEFLFHVEKDGAVEDPDLQAQLGFANLRFADWFRPFWNVQRWRDGPTWGARS